LKRFRKRVSRVVAQTCHRQFVHSLSFGLFECRSATFSSSRGAKMTSLECPTQEAGNASFHWASAQLQKFPTESSESGFTISHLGESAFSQCCSLRSIFIPSSIETISQSCFSHFRNLSDGTFESGSKLAYRFNRFVFHH
jgi:hypothetical protein